MNYLRNCLFVILLASTPVYADLFQPAEVELHDAFEGITELDKWFTAYQDFSNTESLIHLQVDNPNCSNGAGLGTFIVVKDGTDATVWTKTVAEYGSTAVSIILPKNGRIALIFYGADCNRASPSAWYQLSEPIPTSLLPP